MRIMNFKGATLAEARTSTSVPAAAKDSLFAMMSALPAKELDSRIHNIKDSDTRILAQAHRDALIDGWSGPLKG